MTAAPGVVACNLDAETAAQVQAIQQDTVESNDNFPIMARLFAKLVALSLACQYTRSAVLQWGAAVAGAPMYRWDGINHNYRHHPLSHGTTDDFNETAVSGYKDMLFATALAKAAWRRLVAMSSSKLTGNMEPVP